MTFQKFNHRLGKEFGKTHNWTKGLKVASSAASLAGTAASLGGAPEVGVPLLAAGQVLNKSSDLVKNFEKDKSRRR
jgi:hypothetical protein